jgi:hypothetical protein
VHVPVLLQLTPALVALQFHLFSETSTSFCCKFLRLCRSPCLSLSVSHDGAQTGWSNNERSQSYCLRDYQASTIIAMQLVKNSANSLDGVEAALKCDPNHEVLADKKRTGPDRLLYLKRIAEHDRLIEICSQKLQGNPYNDKALMIRASAYLKSSTDPLNACMLGRRLCCANMDAFHRGVRTKLKPMIAM